MSTSKIRFPAVSALLFLTVSLSQSALAGWTLDGEASSLYYVTSKAAAISELNSFTRLEGSIQDDGSASVAIFLDSVDTAIEIRDERMRDIVFEAGNYEIATVSLAADMEMLDSLGPGETVHASYQATLDLHGMQQSLPVELVITGLANGGLLATLNKPLIVNVAQFGLAGAVEQLREIAGLPSINTNIVVDFTLQFDAN